MNNKILIAGLLIILLAVGASAYFYLQVQEETAKIEALEQEIEGLSVEKAAVAKKIQDVKEEKKALKSQLQVYSDKLKKIEADSAVIRQEKQRLAKEFSSKENQITQLNAKLDSVASQEVQLKSELANVRSEFENMNDKIESAKREKLLLEEELKKRLSGPKGVELQRIVVKVTPDLEGEILETNREYNFCIIDLGLRDGAHSGDTVAIYRDGDFIAKAVVENVYDDMSSIIIFEKWISIRFLVGDSVKLIRS